jgi:glutathione S-transferase
MHPLVALVTLLALGLFLWMTARVGAARRKFGIAAPAITGHPEFERHFRVQANTIEGLIVFLPSLWLFAIFANADPIAAVLGLVWIVGRVVYMQAYAKAAESRSLGFGIQALAMLALLFGAVGAVIWALVKSGF